VAIGAFIARKIALMAVVLPEIRRRLPAGPVRTPN
jgi:hypothetical protein